MGAGSVPPPLGLGGGVIFRGVARYARLNALMMRVAKVCGTEVLNVLILLARWLWDRASKSLPALSLTLRLAASLLPAQPRKEEGTQAVQETFHPPPEPATLLAAAACNRGSSSFRATLTCIATAVQVATAV